MFEADALCQRIAVINQGKLIALDTPEMLKRYVSDLSVIEVEVYGIPDELVQTIKAQPYVDSVHIENREQKQLLQVQSLRGAEAVSDLVTLLNGLRVGRVIVREPTLEDAYVRLVGGKA
jgi:ABC-2 type transport system ATP-binding protein